jgi:LysM repeat protein
MAIRRQELPRTKHSRAVVYGFPTSEVRRRARAQAQREVLVRVLGAAVLAVAMVIAAARLTATPVAQSRPSAPAVVNVQPGQTLWGIAQRYQVAGSDPRAYVDALEELNHVGASLQAGERLRLPTRAS